MTLTSTIITMMVQCEGEKYRKTFFKLDEEKPWDQPGRKTHLDPDLLDLLHVLERELRVKCRCDMSGVGKRTECISM